MPIISSLNEQSSHEAWSEVACLSNRLSYKLSDYSIIGMSVTNVFSSLLLMVPSDNVKENIV